MNLLHELRDRRVPQYVSAYVVGGWGLVQFVTFLEGRLLLSPHLVNALALALVLLLPSVAVLAWCHGRPGADRWGRLEKVSIPVNVAAAVALLLVVFADKDLGAVTETVSLQDENGATVERTVPKAEYRRRALLFYLENTGDAADDWLRRGLTVALAVDLSQDPFVDVEHPATRVAALRRMGHGDGLDLPRPLMRELAREAHCPHFVSGSFARDDAGLNLTLELHDTETGRRAETLTLTAPDLYTLVDEASRRLRRALGVPAGHLETQEDLPVADVLTADTEALRDFVQAMASATHDNDYDAAVAPLEDAVARDPSFALAHFLQYAVLVTNGDEAGAEAAMDRAMDNLYRLAERSRFQVKAIYYFNVKSDPDKTRAVLDMWTRLYPYDTAAWQQVAMFAGLRQDHDAVIAAYERILAIDPAQHGVLVQLAEAYQERGDYAAAEEQLRRYADLYPTEVRSFTQLADLHSDAGRIEEARRDLEQAQLIAPDRPETLRDLAAIDIKLGRFAAAEDALRGLRDDADNDEDALTALEILHGLYRTTGRTRQALAVLEDWNRIALRNLHPSQVWLIHAIRLHRLEAPALADSLAGAVRALRPRVGSPNDAMLGMCEANLLAGSGRAEEAAAALAETERFVDAYQLEVLRARVLTVAGHLAELRGDLEEARRIHARGLELDPTSALHLRRLGRLQRLTGQTDEAQRTLARALERNPAQPDANLELALLAADRGDAEAARPHLARALHAWEHADADHPGAAAARALAARLDTAP